LHSGKLSPNLNEDLLCILQIFLCNFFYFFYLDEYGITERRTSVKMKEEKRNYIFKPNIKIKDTFGTRNGYFKK
jgi:hypothetical protein